MAKRNVSGTEADPTIRFAPLELGGVTYQLAYDFNAIAEAEFLARCNLLSGLESLQSLTAAQFRGLFYAALSPAHPEITVQEAGRMITLEDGVRLKIANAIAKAYKLSMPDKKDPPGAAAPAGS
jgi:hypothetical protein